MSRPALEAWVAALADVPERSFDDLDDFLRGLETAPTFARSVESAAYGGALADRLGYGFVAGYHAALGRLLARTGDPTPLHRGRACLAATESGGVHPKAMLTTLSSQASGWVLDGTKTFVTLAQIADDVVVIARREPRADRDEGARPTIVAVKVPRDRAGITLTPKAPTPFAPEVPHAELRFERVTVAPNEVLPGDGYADYLKPFRTVEDLHVLAAGAGHLFSIARTTPHLALVPRLVELLATTRALADEAPNDAAVHVALGPLFERARAIAKETLEAMAEGSDAKSRLERDLRLLLVAEAARAQRFEVALATMGLERRT